MLEITGDIFDRDSWSYKPTTPEIALCVTTNGMVKANGQAVMGAGRKRSFPVVEGSDRRLRLCAKAFTKIYPQLPAILGQRLACGGNQVYYLLTQGNIHILSFPPNTIGETLQIYL